jgi:hypothetical protein
MPLPLDTYQIDHNSKRLSHRKIPPQLPAAGWSWLVVSLA